MPDLYIGLMSGTSLDGIDAALVAIQDRQISPVDFAYRPFSATLKQRIHQLSQANTPITLSEYGSLDTELGYCFADAVKQLLAQSQTPASSITAIGSHGQTVYHSPAPPQAFTLQIGDPNIIAEQTGISTVADFRRRDLAAGGQGAPLVPAFHQAVFRHPTEHRCIVNIGGIANITVLPPGATPGIIGFDTGPGNTLMDQWIHTQRGLGYDANGDWGKSGQPCQALLAALLADPYFQQAPPKSTGKEYFSLAWLQPHLGCHTDNGTDNNADIQATLCALTAATISQAINQYAPHTERVLVCGGGVHNNHLLNLLAQQLACPIASTLGYGLHPDHVEAIAFAWLAQQTITGKTGNLPEATGARQPVVLGGIYQASSKQP